MNTKKSILTILFAIFAVTICFFGCKKVNEGDNDIQKAPGNSIVWNGDVDKPFAMPIGYTPSQKQNASGPKIPSNSHSSDFPGIYFIWDSKQKDNGYLKVHYSVLSNYASFVLTTKEGGNYYDFKIETQDGQEQTLDECYVFFIAKVQNNKNINMVFVSEMTPRLDQ